RGRPMMINVWAQWCEPCRAEAPYIAEVATVNSSDLMVLGLNFQETRPELAIEFAQFASWRYPQMEDPDQSIKAPLQLVGMPQTFFVRADGTIAHRQTLPFRSADEIRSVAKQYLGVTP
ncbi:MAG TPA: TlpA disulfide reductase family protein, partial [Propionibacteriaceae bacterium]